MKILKYNLCTRMLVSVVDSVSGLETKEMQDVLTPVTMDWNEINESTAKREAYNGKYTIEDDGTTETPTELDKLDARLTYVEMMTGILEE